MATYVIGDVHGCYDSLQALLARLEIDERRDALWLVGDLVNRGPRSLDVLRWAQDCARRMEDRFVTVLGNHDLHLIARDAGVARRRSGDTLEAVLEAADRRDLVEWLARRPVLHRRGNWLLVHAGLLPAWSLVEAENLARAVEAGLRGEARAELVLRSPSTAPALRRSHTALAAFSRLRTCTPAGELCTFSGPPAEAPTGCWPWFDLPGRWRGEARVLFGHWAALGLHLGEGVCGLDTGCVWGGGLTAMRLEDGRLFQVETREPDAGQARR